MTTNSPQPLALENELRARYDAVAASVRQAATECGRDTSQVRIIAVSKTQPLEVLEAALQAGITTFGENYAQELRDKHAQLSTINSLLSTPEWHCIGHLQTNKVKMILPAMLTPNALLHSVDSEKLAQEINKHAANAHGIVNILLQVNTSGEESKSGCEPHEIFALAETALSLPNVRVRGLMTIAAMNADAERVRPMFRLLRSLRDELRTKFRGISYFDSTADATAFSELSMGMSGDFRVAIEEGATLVRIGTAIFGARDYAVSKP
jgi:pyridoxal phosphate enzyme (YggS family)